MTAMAVNLGPARRARRIGLAPMVDVVFLLLVFFMLASRFGIDTAVPVASAAGGGGAWEGPPRLVSVASDGLRLNGRPVTQSGLVAALAPLMPSPGAPVILRPAVGSTVQDVLDVIGVLEAGGIGTVLVVP